MALALYDLINNINKQIKNICCKIEQLQEETNIYNSDGVLTGDRIVDTDVYSINFTSTANPNTFFLNDGKIGIGTSNPTKLLSLNEGDISIVYSDATLYSDLINATGPILSLSGSSIDRSRIGVESTNAGAITLGIRGESELNSSGFGKQKDSFLYASATNNGLNIINAAGTGTEDYIRFYAGKVATANPDVHIQGVGSNKGFVGIGTIAPTAKLHIDDVMRLEPRVNEPSTANEGDIYYDSTLKKLRVYDGVTWQNCW